MDSCEAIARKALQLVEPGDEDEEIAAVAAVLQVERDIAGSERDRASRWKAQADADDAELEALKGRIRAKLRTWEQGESKHRLEQQAAEDRHMADHHRDSAQECAMVCNVLRALLEPES